ncbi:MAG: bifunctional YncE family protein/alkaline phosphatase family protein [Chitinophagaceae bacterium]
MKKYLPVLMAAFAFLGGKTQTLSELESRKVQLPNGWSLTPAGKSLHLGDLPLNIAVSSSQKFMAVTNNGQSIQSLQLIDVTGERLLDSVVIPKSWYGLQFSSDEKFLYASGGNDNRVVQYAIVNKKLVLKDSFLLGKKWPAVISPAGLVLDDVQKLLYVVTKENNSLYVIDIPTKKIVHQLPLGTQAYTCLLSPNKQVLYISLWGGDKILFYDTRKRIMTDSIATGDNPNEICQTKNGKYLFVANSNDNSVSVIDLVKRKVVETLNAALFPNAPNGSTTNGVALNATEKTLYVANASNNCLAVFDVSKPGSSKSKGFIPVGWYPTNVKVIGRKIFVTNGKGFTSMANPRGPNPIQRKQEVRIHEGDAGPVRNVQYIAGLFKGTMSIINEPDEKQLSVYSKLVYQNTPYTKEKELTAQGEQGNPVPSKVGASSPIKYVFYILKENRTYDQVLGDMPEGNGDTSLVLFGKDITPNQHALAKQFVLLDNFYVDGEVSADGHNWSLGAYATDYNEKAWPTSYGQRGGANGGGGSLAVANNKGGFIWDHCKRAGVTYRNYGMFMSGGKPRLPSLEGKFCPYYSAWDISVRDTSRFYQWKRDFDSLIAINAVPQFNSLLMPCDHTEGVRLGAPTPFAHVADNDLAVGLFIDYLSKSPIWNESVVFILEDDAQNGPDHVDAHRSTAYVAGGYIKRGYVDHTMYSTSSMLRTIELILGIPPMSQYDAAATPMWNCFDSTPNTKTFTALPALVNLNDKNQKVTALTIRSALFDLSKEDAIPDLEFTDVLWKSIKGENALVPAPRRSAFFKAAVKDDGE